MIYIKFTVRSWSVDKQLLTWCRFAPGITDGWRDCFSSTTLAYPLNLFRFTPGLRYTCAYFTLSVTLHICRLLYLHFDWNAKINQPGQFYERIHAYCGLPLPASWQNSGRHAGHLHSDFHLLGSIISLPLVSSSSCISSSCFVFNSLMRCCRFSNTFSFKLKYVRP